MDDFIKKGGKNTKMKEYLNPKIEVTFLAKADVLTFSVNQQDVTGQDVEWDRNIFAGN